MQNQSHNILDTSQVGRLLMKLTLPMFFGTLVQGIYTIVDTIFISRYVGPLGIASLAVVFPLQMFAMGTGTMVGIGGASLISRLIGGSDRERAERALGNSIALSLLFSIVLMLAVVPFVSFWARLIGATENVLPFARDYLRITYSGVIFNITSSVLLNLIRSEGNARVSMISMIMQSVLNILLDWLFIKEIGMGVKGAALATLISQAIAMGYALSYYLTKSGYLQIRIANFVPDTKILKSIFAIGISQFAQTIAMSGSAMLLVRMMSTYGSDISLAVFGILQRIMWFSMMPGQVLGQGMQPILGFNYGAKRYHQALKVMNIAFFYSIIIGIIVFVVFFFWPEPVIRIFTSDAPLIAAAAKASKIIFIVLPLFGFYNVGQLVFPSIGKAKETFIIAIARPIAFMTPLVLILPRFFQMDGVWAAFPGADVLTFVLTIALLIPLFRQFKKAAADQRPPDAVQDKPTVGH